MDRQPIDTEEIKSFLMRANMPHALGTAKTSKESDGSRTITYVEGRYRMDDNFFGGEPYGGRLVIFAEKIPVFIEVYYGRVYDTDLPADAVYDFLREALRYPDEENPFRGPAHYKQGSLVYSSATDGDVVNHTVHEWIHENGREIYSATVLGGLVDRNASGAM